MCSDGDTTDSSFKVEDGKTVMREVEVNFGETVVKEWVFHSSVMRRIFFKIILLKKLYDLVLQVYLENTIF